MNPHNGPGDHSIPDANYIRELPRLAAFDNVQLLGYVHVTYTKRDLGQVLQDVAVYSAWAESSGVGGLAVNGIFVDETPNSFDAISEQYLGQLGQKIKASSGLGPQNIVSQLLERVKLKLPSGFRRLSHCDGNNLANPVY